MPQLHVVELEVPKVLLVVQVGHQVLIVSDTRPIDNCLVAAVVPGYAF